jgi:poly-gamma-glutamate system protein
MFNRPFKPGIKISSKILFLLFLIALIGLFLVKWSTTKRPHPARDRMIAAAKKVVASHKALMNYRDSLAIKFNAEYDPIKSGLIGEEFTPITTTLGDLKSKQLSTSPDFAALFIFWFDKLGLQPGQHIVIHASASFPALILSALIAAEEWQLKPLILSSAGSSSFGANHRLSTWWDMESYLYNKGIIHIKTSFATPGGQDDNGESFWEEGMTICKDAATRNQLTLFIPESVDHSIRAKYKYINTFGAPGLFINIGGNQAGVGNSRCAPAIPTGLINESLNANKCNGLIHLMNDDNIPVIHMLQIRDLAVQYGLGGDVLSFIEPGTSKIYYQQIYSLYLSVVVALCIICSWVLYYFIRHFHSSRYQDSQGQ